MSVAQPTRSSPRPVVLCVDVDGTLLRTDLLFESFLSLVKCRPWLLAAVPFWVLRGRSYLQRQLARGTSFANAPIPIRQDFLQYLEKESATGRRIVLCSGSDEALVHRFAEQLKFPVEFFPSTVHLKGRRKAQALVERFGSRRFDYAGDAMDDLPVWNQAHHAIVVNASSRLQLAAQALGNVILVLPRTRSAVSAFFRSLRARQWLKNILVFVPLITSHGLLQGAQFAKAAISFLSMSLCASFVYVVNDLMDVESDRTHRSKRKRPFAAGDLPIRVGLLTAPLLLAAGIILSLLLPPMASVLLLTYVTTATAYTFWFKHKMLADVILLSLLYTLRILEGGAATSILVSPWLLAFSLFLFISFAFSKRVAELARVSTAEGIAGRGYLVADLATLASLGGGSGFLACLVLSFYISSENVRVLYAHPGWLWLLLPLLLNWMGRVWIVTMRGQMSDDPIDFVTRDVVTGLTLLCGGLILLLAMKCPIGPPGIQE